MKIKSSLIVICFFVLGCSNENQKKEIEIPPRLVSNDTLDGKQFIAILKDDREFESVGLTVNDLKTIDKLLSRAVNDYNKSLNQNKKKDNKEIIDIRNYKRQYIANKKNNGNIEVWVNCFCQSHDNEDWKSKIVLVNDGGNCFFNLKIDLSNKKYFEFIVNGRA